MSRNGVGSGGGVRRITYDDLNRLNGLLLEDTESDKVEAGNLALDYLSLPGKIVKSSDAMSLMEELLGGLLRKRDYLGVATLLWGRDVFDVRPRSVRMIFRNMMSENRLLLMGGSSVSKTYSAGAWLLIDWLFWPERTNVKFASVSEDHLRTNVFAHIVDLYNSSAIRLPGEAQSMYIGMDPKRRGYGISGVIYPQGTASTGRLKGFKPKPQPKEHPILGTKASRLRVLVDEAQNSTEGVFKDFPSLEGSMLGPENVKIILCFNPEDAGHPVGKLSRPKGGWETFDMEEDEEWVSGEGWKVLRIDPKKTENIVRKKLIFPNFQNYETFLGYMAKGPNSPDYYVFGRGCFPERGVYNSVVQRYHLNRQVGNVRFVGETIDVASVDVALVRDKVILTKGKWGVANAVVKPSGEVERFEDPVSPGKYLNKHVLQVEQQFEIPVYNDTVKTGNDIIRLCKSLGVQPQYLGVDSTGNGLSIYHHLRSAFGNVLPLQWAEVATEKKILNEDIKTPIEAYDRLISEMYFATATWMEQGILWISHEIEESPLFDQLVNRRYNGRGTKGRQRVESKEDYKKRNTLSPDEADSLVMLQQVVRERQDVIPGMLSEGKGKSQVDLSKKFQCIQKPVSLSYAVELKRKASA